MTKPLAFLILLLFFGGSLQASEPTLPQTPGVHDPVVLTHRYGASPQDYFKSGFAKYLYDSLSTKNRRSMRQSPKSQLRYKVKRYNAQVYVPKGYTSEKPAGVFLFISPTNDGYLPARWAAEFDKRNILFIAPHKLGNKTPLIKRMALAMDALETMRKNYAVDQKRIYVGGLSGGGAASVYLGAAYPQVFKGVLCQAMSILLEPAKVGRKKNVRKTVIPLRDVDHKALRSAKIRFAFVTGENDMFYPYILASIPGWIKSGISFRVFDVPGMGHHDAFQEGLFPILLDWLEGKSVAAYPPRSAES